MLLKVTNGTLPIFLPRGGLFGAPTRRQTKSCPWKLYSLRMHFKWRSDRFLFSSELEIISWLIIRIMRGSENNFGLFLRFQVPSIDRNEENCIISHHLTSTVKTIFIFPQLSIFLMLRANCKLMGEIFSVTEMVKMSLIRILIPERLYVTMSLVTYPD
jgi:hypothetical protein